MLGEVKAVTAVWNTHSLTSNLAVLSPLPPMVFYDLEDACYSFRNKKGPNKINSNFYYVRFALKLRAYEYIPQSRPISS